MSRRQVSRCLALEAAAIGIVGSVGAIAVGLALGVLMCLGFGARIGGTVPPTIPWALLLIATTAGVVIAMVATLQPRRLALRPTIVDALRVE